MSTNFPGALDALTNPAATDSLTGHASQHANTNDAIEALQAKVGINGSADASSLDYKATQAVAHAADFGNPHGTTAAQVGAIPTSDKGAVSGVAPLDATGKISAVYLPSYVDVVLEYANFASFPGAGETGKIYIALDTNKTYRWSGSAYVEISPSPGTTDSLTEGTTNLYFTTARARAALSATGAVSYNSATGVISAELTSGYASKTVATNTTLAADTEYETGRNLRINHGVNLAIPASTKLIVRKYAAGSSL